jgi:putative acetyltransferase
MRIRDYKPDDAAILVQVFHQAVHAIGSKDYTRDQVDAWSPAPVPADTFHARVSDGRSVFVAVDDDEKPIAFVELERDGHIDCFYCHPGHAGSGVGKALYERLEREALEAGVSRLYVEASEAARRFFLRAGFVVVRRRDFERNNVQIHNYLMEKTIR